MSERQETVLNPFAALIEQDSEENNKDCLSLSHEEIQLNKLITSIFSFTIDPKAATKDQPLVYLEDLAESFRPKKTINLNLLEQALFERLLIEEPESCIIPIDSKPDTFISEKKVIIYLYIAYINLKNSTNDKELLISIKNVIINNILTALKQPDIYPEQNLGDQFVDLSKTYFHGYDEFLDDVINQCLQEEEGITLVEPYMHQVLKALSSDLSNCMVELVGSSCVTILEIFTKNIYLADILLDFCNIPEEADGILYENTVLGQLLNISILKKSSKGAFSYFTNPTYHQNSTIESNLWSAMELITDISHKVFLSLLKCSPEIKNKTLTWIGNCLKANNSRGTIWNAQTEGENPSKFVSDAFMVNLSIVLLTLCEPFCNLSKDAKLLKVDPTYCAVPPNQMQIKEIHLSLFEETCLVPNETETDRPTASKYNFMTECFYLAHKAVDLGIRVAVDKFIKLNQDIARLQRTFNEVMSQIGSSPGIVDNLKQRLDSQMTQFLCFKATLLQPKLIDLMMMVLTSTAHWMTQVCVTTEFESNGYHPETKKKITFPLPETLPVTLQCIPELMMENIISYLTFLRRYNANTFEVQNYSVLSPLLTFLLTFMGSPQRIRNPHLRARMAEALEALLPYHGDDPPGLNGVGFQREKLFTEHPHRLEIVSSLLEVFVGIEMTGESVQFEQKFHYRRPMYLVIKYLINMEEHQACFVRLAEEANENMEAVKPPLFLRFVNLLINDAIFLLDEALSNMSQLRTMQTARDNGEWDNLSAMDRATNYNYIQHTGMLARFDNILSKDTINTLVQLTSRITIVFTHPTMVDRVAAMLNYFLLSLVGPNKKNFKVKDQKEYEFDPAGTVLDICKLYVNLKDSEAFCLAVSHDGRSYKPELFTLAEDVLVRIGGGNLVGELQQIAAKVAVQALKQQEEQEAIADAPDEFLDPIMSTLMYDPVILPSSRQIVDRTTIARHLLSDQSDPFNRSPLTMDQVVPATELAKKIKDWLEKKK